MRAFEGTDAEHKSRNLHHVDSYCDAGPVFVRTSSDENTNFDYGGCADDDDTPWEWTQSSHLQCSFQGVSQQDAAMYLPALLDYTDQTADGGGDGLCSSDDGDGDGDVRGSPRKSDHDDDEQHDVDVGGDCGGDHDAPMKDSLRAMTLDERMVSHLMSCFLLQLSHCL